MIKTFPIDFVRQALEQKMYEAHLVNPNFFGGKDQVNILSFYEQLKSQDEVDRFVETYRDLTEQQNRTGLILNGVLVSPENPSITNLYSSLIVPMTFTCSLRCNILNRDQSIDTINNLTEKLKGRKVDIAQLKCNGEQGYCYKPFVVGTIGQGMGKPKPQDGDYYGLVGYAGGVATKMYDCFDIVDIINADATCFYCQYNDKIRVVKKSIGSQFEYLYTQDVIRVKTNNRDYITEIDVKFTTTGIIYSDDLPILSKTTEGTIDIIDENEVTHTVNCNVELYKYEKDSDGHLVMYFAMHLKTLFNDDHRESIGDADIKLYNAQFDFIESGDIPIAFPPEHESFEKYKLSFSFDAIRCDEPRNLNGDEYCELSFGGSATLVNEKVKLGNDLIKVGIKRNNIIKSNGSNAFSDAFEYLEPLEMPSGNNANTQISQLVSNNFKTNTHTDGIALTLQYTFIADESFNLITKWFDYARYGDQSYITPNIIYSVNEIWSSWGNYVVKNIKTKIVENVEIENTESDTLTLSVNMQIQGDNH